MFRNGSRDDESADANIIAGLNSHARREVDRPAPLVPELRLVLLLRLGLPLRLGLVLRWALEWDWEGWR